MHCQLLLNWDLYSSSWLVEHYICVCIYIYTYMDICVTLLWMYVYKDIGLDIVDEVCIHMYVYTLKHMC